MSGETRSPRRGMCAAVLSLEAITLGLTTPVMVTIAGVELRTALVVDRQMRRDAGGGSVFVIVHLVLLFLQATGSAPAAIASVTSGWSCGSSNWRSKVPGTVANR